MKNKKYNFIAKMLSSDKSSNWALPLTTIILTIIASSVILLIMGKNPGLAFVSFLQGSGFIPKASYGGGQGQISDIFAFLSILAPMILASLAFVVGFKSGLFNIGIAGQMLAAGFVTYVLIGYSDLPAVIAKPLVIIVGIIAGALVGAFIGFLKYKFNIHEVVSTIMVNYIISYLTGFFINTYYADPVTRQAKIISSQSRLSWTGVKIAGCKCNIPLGIVIAIVAAFAISFLFNKTVEGFELKAVGSNRKCAQYSGINVGRKIVTSMALSGLLAGLAGVTYYCGYTNTIVPKSLADMGYDSIAVALLGNASPIGTIFASILVTIFQNGSTFMSSVVEVPKEIASLITAILLLFSACGAYFRYMAKRHMQKVDDMSLEEKVLVEAKLDDKGGDK